MQNNFRLPDHTFGSSFIMDGDDTDHTEFALSYEGEAGELMLQTTASPFSMLPALSTSSQQEPNLPATASNASSDEDVVSDPALWQYALSLELQVNDLQGQVEDLQRQLAQHRSPFTTTDSTEGQTPSQSSDPSKAAQKKKRKYVHRPRKDLNAPLRPLTAYARFASDMRDQYTALGCDFSETAKRIGNDWQALKPSVRQSYTDVAATEKKVYEARYHMYKRSSAHTAHQNYLTAFRQKHGIFQPPEKIPMDDDPATNSNG